MEVCKDELIDKAPQFLLFWSSHGTDLTLFCNLSDEAQDPICAETLNEYLNSLESTWTVSPDAETKLIVSVVIEACKSGSVGEYLFANGGDQRRILTSSGDDDYSYRDIDFDVNSGGSMKSDPNPADTGSETIWGYIEAFGTAAAHVSAGGALTFQQAVDYATKNDVTMFATDLDPPRVVKSWKPGDGGVVHGASNIGQRVPTSVYFTSPALTKNASEANPVKLNVDRGDMIDVEVVVENLGGANEVGALAVRLFRNEKSAPDNWQPLYFEEEESLVRTTEIIPGTVDGEKFIAKCQVRIPEASDIGPEIRMVATLDSGQPQPETTGASATMGSQRSEIIFVLPEEDPDDGGCWLKKCFKKLFG
jgi:hypothetical protein